MARYLLSVMQEVRHAGVARSAGIEIPGKVLA